LHSSALPGSATAGSHRGNEEATFTCGLVERLLAEVGRNREMSKERERGRVGMHG